MNLTHEQLSVSLERLSIKLALSEKARTEQRQEIFKLSDELDKAYGYCDMIQEMYNEAKNELEFIKRGLGARVERSAKH